MWFGLFVKSNKSENITWATYHIFIDFMTIQLAVTENVLDADRLLNWKGIFINQDFMPRALKVISMQFDFSRRTQSCSSLSLNILALLCDLNNLWQTQL